MSVVYTLFVSRFRNIRGSDLLIVPVPHLTTTLLQRQRFIHQRVRLVLGAQMPTIPRLTRIRGLAQRTAEIRPTTGVHATFVPQQLVLLHKTVRALRTAKRPRGAVHVLPVRLQHKLLGERGAAFVAHFGALLAILVLAPMRAQRNGAQQKLLAQVALVRRMLRHQMLPQLGARRELRRTTATDRRQHASLEKRLAAVLDAVMRAQLGDACTAPAALQALQRRQHGDGRRAGVRCEPLRCRHTGAGTVACASRATVAPMPLQGVRIAEGLRAIGARGRAFERRRGRLLRHVGVHELAMLAQVVGAFEGGRLAVGALLGGVLVVASMAPQMLGEAGSVGQAHAADRTEA